jgi:drug/metabolite transporter (DMT)-like permease
VHRSRSLPHLLLATAVLAWGGSFAAIKALVDHGLHAPDVAIGRYLVAAPGFGIALVAAGGLPGLTRRDALRVVVAGLFVVAVYHLALNAGERTTAAGTAGVVIAAAPAMALVMSLGLGLEEFSRRRAVGLAVAFAGWWSSSPSARASGCRSRRCAGRSSCSWRRPPSPPTTCS